MVGARLGLRNGRSDVSLWGGNLLDDTAVMIQGFSAFSGLGINPRNASLGDRRTYEVQLNVRF